MKQKRIGLSQQYVTALQKYLRQSPRASLQPALDLGHQSVSLGLETLDLARMHERAVIMLKLAPGKNGMMRRAEIFFTEALIPIAETHLAARRSKIELNRLNETLSQRTLELAATHRQLQRGVARRKVMQGAHEKRVKHHHQCLQESIQLQNHLRQLTHHVLATQENERKKISLELQDEIGQTLLGINIRLLALKQEARSNTKGLKNKIDKTQRLVAQSVKSVRQYAHELDIQPRA